MTPDAITSAPPTELRRLLASGHAVDPLDLAGFDYRGTSLGLPALVEKLTWKIFRKVFRRTTDGTVIGHNVRIDQGSGEPLRDRTGAPVTFGPYAVKPLPAGGTPFGCRAGVLLDYGAAHPRLHPLGLVRDPLVALVPGSADLLLGATYLALGPLAVRTPSFFLLERINTAQ
ncbi:MAG: hypothetical protein JNL21_10005 [Myxococcales bacterium]|nr:hypothetical protein [Myxococcales bacterium]